MMLWRPTGQAAALLVVLLVGVVGSIRAASPSSATPRRRPQPFLAKRSLVWPAHDPDGTWLDVEGRTSAATAGSVLGVRGGSLIPSAQIAARVANVYFWISGLTSAADGVKAWVDVGIQVPRGSLAEWCSERHGWILLSLSTLLLLVERSSLTVAQIVVVSYVPMMYHMFQGLYSGRVATFNLYSGDAFLLVYHAILLVTVLGCSVTLPTTWLFDGLWWFAGIGTIVAPQSMMRNANLDVAKATPADRLLFLVQGHAALVYACAVRAALHSSAAPTLVSVLQGALLGWVGAIAVFWVKRIELGRSAGFTDGGRYALTGLATVLALLVHRGSFGIP